jgi:hypothetical protein
VARLVVPRVPRDALVDGAARSEGLAVHDLPSAGLPAARGDPQGRGGVTMAVAHLSCQHASAWRSSVPSEHDCGALPELP